MYLGRLRLFVLSALRRFAAAQDGVVAVVLALSLLPVMMMAGTAVDLRRISAARTNLQTTADAAALASVDALRRTTDLSKADENVTKAATAFVNAAFEGAAVQPTISAMRRSANTVTVRLWLRVPTTIMKLARVDQTLIKADATATVGTSAAQPLEMAIVIDTTESMAAGERMATAVQGAGELIDRVMFLPPNNTPNPKARVGLVPFAKYVNVGTRYHTEPWAYYGHEWLKDSLTYEGTLNGCRSCNTTIVPREPKYCYHNDKVRYDCSIPEHEQCIDCIDPYPVPNPASWEGCVGSYENTDETDTVTALPALIVTNSPQFDLRCPKPLVRLTTNADILRQSLRNLTPEGETYLAPGLLWGWRLLSPNPPFGDGSTDPKVKKVIVFMTDGEDTHSPYKPKYYTKHDGTDVDFANEKFLRICDNIKAKGIKIYTISYMLVEPEPIRILRTCASPRSFFNSRDNNDLLQAFTTIGAEVSAMRLIQ